MGMDLQSIIKGRLESAPRVLLYSPPKIGKTGWAAQIPGVLFMASEQGTEEYDVPRIPTIVKCEGRGGTHRCGWAQVKGWLETLRDDPHEYKALAIDTLDWLEAVLFSHLVATCPKGRNTIVEAHGGYGKAYEIAVEEWRKFASMLDVISRRRNMLIAVLAHSTTSTFKDPTSSDYDQYRLKMHKLGSAFWMEWADAILFANFEQVKSLDTGDWTSTGRRVIYTSPHPQFAYVAGNRYGLPPTLDLSYADFVRALEESSPKALETELDGILARMQEGFTYNGQQKTKADVRKAFSSALDRRTMRAIVEAVRSLSNTKA
jgi:hypothetical protein